MNLNKTIEVKFPKENFLKIKETLGRIGEKKNGKTLKRIAYIFHKKGKYYILHYKELKQLDGEKVIITEEDFETLYLIISVLLNWGLVELVDKKNKKKMTPASVPLNGAIKIIPFKEKYKWKFIQTYDIGVF